jgi:hypothetical protein
LIANQLTVHAIYENRERKRNAQLGLPPTLAELIEMIDENPTQKTNPNQKTNEPNQQILDADSLTHTPAEIELKR